MRFCGLYFVLVRAQWHINVPAKCADLIWFMLIFMATCSFFPLLWHYLLHFWWFPSLTQWLSGCLHNHPWLIDSQLCERSAPSCLRGNLLTEEICKVISSVFNGLDENRCYRRFYWVTELKKKIQPINWLTISHTETDHSRWCTEPGGGRWVTPECWRSSWLLQRRRSPCSLPTEDRSQS